SQTVQQTASASEELAATAEEMSGQAQQLQQAMSVFRLRADKLVPSLAANEPPVRRAPARSGSVRGALALDSASENDFTRF
ncbi:methyl-accepting chemotaxis protein, partial [Methyloversatilis sp. NSM2]